MYVSRNLLTLDNVQLYNMIELSRVDCFNELKFEFSLKCGKFYIKQIVSMYVPVHMLHTLCMYTIQKLIIGMNIWLYMQI